MGVRIEHPQSLVNTAQYGKDDPTLPPADYKLVKHLADETVYTFCMCPGGYVVAAASEEGRVVTNGMSYADRDGNNANAALLVTVNPKDFPGDDVLAGVRWQEQIEAAKQTVSMLVIDKKRMRMKESGLPQFVIDQTPKLMRRSKLPIVKAKVGPKIMTLVADEKIFDVIPVKKEVKATVAGIYITDVRGIRGPLPKPEGKKSWRQKLAEKVSSLSKEEAAASKSKKK
jgi:hypothetical protein